MITEKDILDAIKKYQGERNPSIDTCIKLASLYTLHDRMYPQDNGYSYDYEEAIMHYSSDTEFGQLVKGKNPDDVMSIMDELMTALQVLNPPLYASVLRKLY